MITSLIASLHRIGLEPTAEEVAEALWLAVHMGQFIPSQERQFAIDRDGPKQQDEAAPDKGKFDRSSKQSKSETEGSGMVYPQDLQSSGVSRTGSGIFFRTPAAFALPGALKLARALHPLMRRIPSRTDMIFDEEATIQQIAEAGLWIPALRQAPERWFEIALIVDEGLSMVVWRQTVAEVKLLLERLGAFRDVRVWGLVTDAKSPQEEAWLRAEIGPIRGVGRVRNPQELIDPTGRRIILVITDCVSPAWYNGTAERMLAIWGRTNPVAIVQVLPQQFWSQSALREADIVRVHASSPGTPNTKLKVESLSQWTDTERLSKIPIPVVTLEPLPLATWAHLVTGSGNTWAPGLILPLEAIESGQNEQLEAPDSPELLVQRFQATASSMAFELAGLLAAAPLSLPVMRLVQQTMLPQSRQIHLAEVFLSGLLKQINPSRVESDPDSIQYDFRDGVREVLFNSIEVPDAVQVLQAVSNAIKGRLGRTLDFSAILVDPTITDGIAIDERGQAFAIVAARVLRRLGGRYMQVAERLEQAVSEASAQEQSTDPSGGIEKSASLIMPNVVMTRDGTIISADSLPAILMGGPPNAGKSVLAYNLTRELRRREIPHYVFRASPEIEGDWFFEGDLETVRQIQLRVSDYRHWTDIFREFVCRDLAHRHLPLIVDLNGLPRDADNCIFQACTHSILLLKPENEEATQTWRHYTTTNGLMPLAELRSQMEGNSFLTAEEPIITGTITGLVRGVSLHNPVFDALLERVSQLFSSIDPDELEKFHLDTAPIEFVVHLPHQLHALTPDTDEWTVKMLQPLLAKLPMQTAMAVYGRARNWVYCALATHAGTQPFYQFDARLGWVTPPALQASTSGQLSQPLIYIKEENYNDSYIILIHPIHNYLDYREADQLVFPEPPSHRGVVLSGKLPHWLFTALSRFYAQRDVLWIALNDARDNRPVVTYSQMSSHPIGKILPKLA